MAVCIDRQTPVVRFGLLFQGEAFDFRPWEMTIQKELSGHRVSLRINDPPPELAKTLNAAFHSSADWSAVISGHLACVVGLTAGCEENEFLLDAEILVGPPAPDILECDYQLLPEDVI